MKKLLLLLAVTGIAFLSSCDKEPKPKEEPFPIGAWRTTHQYFSLTVNYAVTEELKELREKETSVAVSEAESYKLMFNEDGTGSGSGVHPDGTGRYDFDFTWELSDGKITITGSEPVFYCNQIASEKMDWTDEEIVWKEKDVAWEKLDWKIEGSADDNMVLSAFSRIGYSIAFTRLKYYLDETQIHRYTFEKVK